MNNPETPKPIRQLQNDQSSGWNFKNKGGSDCASTLVPSLQQDAYRYNEKEQPPYGSCSLTFAFLLYSVIPPRSLISTLLMRSIINNQIPVPSTRRLLQSDKQPFQRL